MGRLFDQIILKWNYRLIRKFSVCWVPDWPGEISLAGRLSHPTRKPPFLVVYIGILSRFSHLPGEPEKNSLLVLISGPEPQRRKFENLILPQLLNLSMKCTVLRGLPGNKSAAPIYKDHIRIFDHLPADKLNALLNSSELILTRSGYSSIMDLVQSGKNGILVPTPGQAEQEYLGVHLQKMNWMVSFREKNFNLNEAIKQLRSSNPGIPPKDENRLDIVITELLKICESAAYSNQRRPRQII
jgi:UDP-N-acetylglucosamine transferase subunit ALG13